MRFFCRNNLPLLLHEREGSSKILSVVIHFLPDDLEWANSCDQRVLLNDLAKAISENLDDICSYSAEDISAKMSFQRMASNSNFAVSYVVHPKAAYRSVIHFRRDSLNDAIQYPFYRFEVSLFIFPRNSNDGVSLAFPVDTMTLSDFR